MYAAAGTPEQLCLRRDGAVRRSDSDCRCGGRSAGGAVRSGVFFRRRCKKYIRHRLLSADEYGRQTGLFSERAGYDDCMGTGWENLLCTGRLRVCRRCADSVAARRAEADFLLCGVRDARLSGTGYRRVLCSARIYRTGCAVLGCICTRRDCRIDARHQPLSHRPRGAGIHCTSGQ